MEVSGQGEGRIQKMKDTVMFKNKAQSNKEF
jgi:hypothetical protein